MDCSKTILVRAPASEMFHRRTLLWPSLSRTLPFQTVRSSSRWMCSACSGMERSSLEKSRGSFITASSTLCFTLWSMPTVRAKACSRGIMTWPNQPRPKNPWYPLVAQVAARYSRPANCMILNLASRSKSSIAPRGMWCSSLLAMTRPVLSSRVMTDHSPSLAQVAEHALHLVLETEAQTEHAEGLGLRVVGLGDAVGVDQGLVPGPKQVAAPEDLHVLAGGDQGLVDQRVAGILDVVVRIELGQDLALGVHQYDVEIY